MTYRNDHEAALQRVAALETELARLRRNAPPEPRIEPPRPTFSHRFGWAMAGLGMVITAVGISLYTVRMIDGFEDEEAFQSPAPPEPPMEAPSLASAPAPPELASLHACRAGIVPLDPRLGVDTTDPHGEHPLSVRTIEHVAAPCDPAATADLGPDVQHRIEAWADTEARLSNAISLIETYYDANPYALDNYATAPQLWRELRHAISDRDRALVELPELGTAPSTVTIPPARS